MGVVPPMAQGSLSHTQLLSLCPLGLALEDLAEVLEAKGGQWVGLGLAANRNGPCSLSRLQPHCNGPEAQDS